MQFNFGNSLLHRHLPLAAVIAVALAAACAGNPAKDPGASASGASTTGTAVPAPTAARSLASDATELETLYQEMDEQIARFDEALELLIADDRETGMARLEAASATMRGLTDLCLRRPGCDVQRAFAAYDYLVDRQQQAFRDLHLHLDSFEPMMVVEPPRETPEVTYTELGDGLKRSVNLLGDVDLREIINLNGPVKAALDDWLTWLRPQLMSTFHNYQFLKPQMAPVYEEEGLPEAILFGILAAESGGKVHSYSRAGAVGPLQFIRATGQKYGLGQVDGFDMRLDPTAATRANAAYLKDQLAALNNNLEKVLAAYNGGEYRMRRVHRSYPQNGFFDRQVYYQFPRETREYVPRVLAAAWLFLHPGDYGLEFPELDTETMTRTFDADIALGELAVCLGQEGNPDGWFRTLRNLNPRFDADERIEAGTPVLIPASLGPVYEARCREGELIASARELFDANYPEQPEMIPYTVRQGDSLGRIAARYPCVSLRELASINRISPPRYVIRTGQRLNIPACG